MMAMGAVAARLKACKRQQCARRSYDASCLALRDGALTGACYLQRDAAKLYAEAQACMKLADEGANVNLTDLAGTTWSATMTVPLLILMVLIVTFGAEVGWLMAEPPAS